MAKKKPKKRIDLRRPIRHREGEVPVPAFHAQMIVKSAPPVVRKAAGTIKQVDETRRLITFVASEELADRDGDVVRSAGIDVTNYRKNPVFLVDHDPRRPIGKTTDLRLTVISGHPALVGEAEVLPAGTSVAADAVWREIVGGVRAAVSIGFLLKDFEPRFEQGRPVGRILRELELLEISSVVLPSCPSCLVTATSAVKSCCPVHEPAVLAARTAEVVEEYHRLRERAMTLDALVALARPFPGDCAYKILRHNDAREVRNVAVALAGEACDQLGVKMPDGVELVGPVLEGETADFHEQPFAGCLDLRSRTIYLARGLGARDLARVVGHEVAHLAGYSEYDAERFGAAFAAREFAELDAPRPGAGWTAEQLAVFARVIQGGIPITR